MIEYRIGDLFEQTDLKAFAHGCNCAGVMGAGIAVEFKKRYPNMFELYRTFCKGGAIVLGDCFTWTDVPSETVIFNLMTQPSWKAGAILAAIEKSVSEMCIRANDLGIKRIGMPVIGCGLGGLSWEEVGPLMERLSEDYDVTFVVVKLYP